MGGEGIPAQLTKSARLGGDSETRTLKGPGEATWASRRAALAKLERAAFRSMGHFQQVHATAPSTRSAESSSSDSFGSPRGTALRNGFGESGFEATLAGTNRVALLPRGQPVGFSFQRPDSDSQHTGTAVAN